MSFLQAEWRKLALANYQLDPALLKDFLPAKTELDLWNGTCYVSLVGFMFLNTKMLGVKIPFHVNFEEVNLRFYVKYKEEGIWKRGVVFIKEIVPKWALSLVANTVYREHYQTLPMRHQWQEKGNSLMVQYEWKLGKEWQNFTVYAQKEAVAIEGGSEAEFITEHYWGYTRITPQKTFEYQVTHPRWKHYPVTSSTIEVDFGKVYGDRFAMLTTQPPLSVMLAEGSLITVEGKKKL
ncbi:MAG: DUF2071 domain-containing protein [Bacteroidota bacterium]